MSFQKTFLNARSLNAATRELSIEQLEETWLKLSIIIDKRKAAAEEEEQESKQKLETMQAYMKEMEEKGINPSEFAELCTTGRVRTKGFPLPAKYKYTDPESGREKTWSGHGRIPTVIKEALENGQSKDDFLI